MAELTQKQRIEAQIEKEKQKQEDKLAKMYEQLEKAEENAVAGIVKLKDRAAKVEATIKSKEESLATSKETLAKILETLEKEETALAKMQGEDDTNTDDLGELA